MQRLKENGRVLETELNQYFESNKNHIVQEKILRDKKIVITNLRFSSLLPEQPHSISSETHLHSEVRF